MHNFQGEVTDISAETEAQDTTRAVTNQRQNCRCKHTYNIPPHVSNERFLEIGLQS